MTKFFTAMIAGSFFIVNSLQAQVILPADILTRGEMVHGLGYSPKTLESLVGTSAIIVKGRFSKLIKNELFYGFGNTRESMIRIYGFTEAEADAFGMPMSDYEVIIDEILLGDMSLKGKSIIYKLSEQRLSSERFTDPSISRLFFLARNPDGSYAAMGPASVQNERNGYYSYDSLAANPNEFTGRTLQFVDDTSIEGFTKLVGDEIARMYGH